MGAEEDQQNQRNEQPVANSITQAQFLSWKRQKDLLPILFIVRYLINPRTSAHARKWRLGKKAKDADESARKDETARKRAEDIAAGTVQMNGRELFAHEPWVFDNTLY